MNLAQTLTQSAANWPDKTALVFEGRRWTYAQWNRAVNKAAHAFRAAGIGKGDRVAFLTYNLPEQVTGFYALMKIGAVPVPINYRLAANEVKYIVDDSKARILVFEEALRDPVAADPGSPFRQSIDLCRSQTRRPGDRRSRSSSRRASRPSPRPRSAGTTPPSSCTPPARPAGRRASCARTSPRSWAAMRCRSNAAFAHDDTILNNKPLFHIAQLHLQFVPFVHLGATNVLTRGFDVHETLSLVGSERITVLHGVPTQMVMMIGADLSKYDLRSLRCGFFGGQTLADDVTRKCHGAGSRSTSPTSTAPPKR